MASDSAPIPSTAPPESPATSRAGEARKPYGGVLYNWGPQAWIDMVMSKRMLVDRAGPLVVYTFLPILRMTTDPEQIDRDWAVVKEKRETVRFFNSPREKWRKRYGNFVREAEWALLELRKHFNQEQYESIVVGTSVALAHENSTDFLEMMNSMSDQEPKKKKKKAKSTTGPREPSWFENLMFEMFNPAGFLTGPAKITEFDPEGGKTTMYIPECAWHIAGKQSDLPNPDKLPEEGCLLICKGAFEQLFKGEGGGLRMEFEPHLPETACTARMSWKPAE